MRKLLPNINLETRYLSLLRPADFWKFIIVFAICMIPNFLAIVIFSKLNVVMLISGLVISGSVFAAYAEVDQCDRVIDVFFQIKKYAEKGDRLYESNFTVKEKQSKKDKGNTFKAKEK